jgi:hypothetical protein
MDNLEAAIELIRMYGDWRNSNGYDERVETAVAIAVGALRKDSEWKNESN